MHDQHSKDPRQSVHTAPFLVTKVNIARFANDKGLLLGSRKMVEFSDCTNHPLGCKWVVVERTTMNESNYVYRSNAIHIHDFG